MNKRELTTIRENYPGASWAIWSRDFPGSGSVEEDPEMVYNFIEERNDRLNANVIMVSLNPSRGLPEPFSNFHSPSGTHYDYRLKEFIQDNGLERLTGAYMTDLSTDVDPRSENVDLGTEDIDRFLNQLEVLDREEYHVICFIGKVFRTLRSVFDEHSRELEHGIKSFDTDWNETTLHVYRVWFYGNWGANADKVPELKSQLEYLNDHIQ